MKTINNKSKISAAVALSLVAVTANAAPILENGTNFIFSEFYTNNDANGDFTAFGLVSAIRGESGTAAYQATAGNEVTFQFGTTRSSLISGSPELAEYTNTYMNFFEDASANSNPATGLGYGDGSLLLDLVGHSYTSGFTGAAVDLSSVAFSINTFVTTFLSGTFDVGAGGGSLNSLFDTNTIAVAGSATFADLDFDASYSTLASGVYAADNSGTADLRGIVQNIPEPTLLALIGFGLIGLGVFRKTAA